MFHAMRLTRNYSLFHLNFHHCCQLSDIWRTTHNSLYHTYRNQKHLLRLLDKLASFQRLKWLGVDPETKLKNSRGFANESSSSPPSPQKDPGQSSPALSATARLKEAVIKVIPRKKDKVKEEGSSHLSRERNFLTPIRAMSEFLLTPSDLEDLRQTKRRSPFENEPPITVYWMKDVEAKAIKVWGSMENLQKQKEIRDRELTDYQKHLYQLKRMLRSYQRERKLVEKMDASADTETIKRDALDTSGKVVWTAVIINGGNFVMKLGAWVLTGSHSMFAEALHSLADFTNQLILAYGIHKSKQEANPYHPYGYTSMRYVSSLISGAMIFCLGAGVSFQHGISGLMHPSEVMPLYWAYFSLLGSLCTEGGTLLMAINAIKKGAKQQNMNFAKYVFRGGDPSVNVVLLEDMAAVLGVGVAFGCMGLTSVLESHVPDAIGSCLIGSLLAGVSAFIIYTNSAALVGRSIPHEDVLRLNSELEADVMIRASHDVKGIDMGSGFVRFKAEVDFDGRELTRKYLAKQDLGALLAEMNSLKTVEEVELFLLKHGENIVEALGAEVDRIEKSLKKKHPEVRHIDLEIL